MTDASNKHTGGCLCGAVRYEFEGQPDWSAHCHCRSCQRALGAAFATWCTVDSNRFEFTKGELKICETSPGVKRGFCGNCGTSMTYGADQAVEGQDWQGQVWFLAATLDDPAIATPKTHVYVSHRQPWAKLDDGLPQFEEF